MRTLVIFLHWMEGAMKLCIEACFICFIDKFLFLKNYTEEQKRKIQILFYISLISSIINAILCFAAGYNFITFYAPYICDVIFFLTVVALVLYANMAGRKKAKWLGILFVIPLMGYSGMLDFIFDTINLLPMSRFYIELINFIIEIFLLLGMIYLSYEKTKPDFIRKLVSRYAPYEAYPYIEPNVRFSRIRLPTKRIVHSCPVNTDIYLRSCQRIDLQHIIECFPCVTYFLTAPIEPVE